MKLEEFIDACFSEGGALTEVLPEYRLNPLQRDYAHAVAAVLEDGNGKSGTAIGLFEAETGTGKSLAYLLPMAWYAAQGHRVAISTYTNYLQQQLYTETWPLVERVTAQLLGVHLAAAPRIGLRNFISIPRAMKLLDERPRPDRELVSRFIRWMEKGSGVIGEWVKEYGELPYGMKPDQVACRPYDPEADLERYNDHLSRSRAADVVFTNHALALLYSMGRDVLKGDRPISALVIDEADQIDNVAAAVVSKRVSLRAMQMLIHRSLEYSDSPRVAAAAMKMQQCIEGVWEQLAARRKVNELVQPITGHLRGLRDQALVLSDGLNRYLRSLRHARLQRPLSEDWLDEIDHMKQILSMIARDEQAAAHAVPLISWSEKQGIPSFMMAPLDPGRLIGRYTRESRHGVERPALEAMIMTSATLTDGRKEGLDVLPRRYALRPGRLHKQRYEPAHFGEVRFVLMDAQLPNPTPDRGNRRKSCSRWLDNLAGMIECAQSCGGRTLVLMLSNRDVEEVVSRLRHVSGLLVHHGNRLHDLIGPYCEREDSILISAAAWEGVDLPGYIDHLVISRLPYAPPGSPEQLVKIRQIQGAGYSSRVAEKIVYAESLGKARRKFRQGFGRGIRRSDDRVRIWIGDPRFGESPFRSVLPRRFVEPSGLKPSALDQAAIWSPDQGLVSAEGTGAHRGINAAWS